MMTTEAAEFLKRLEERIMARLELFEQKIDAHITPAREVEMIRQVAHEHGGAIAHLQERVERIEAALPPTPNGAGE